MERSYTLTMDDPEVEERASRRPTDSEGKPIKKQDPRLEVRISPTVKKMIRPLYSGRKGAIAIVYAAERLTLRETLRLLREEPPERDRNSIVWVSPTEELLHLADSNDITPHLLVRAACVKLYKEMLDKEDNDSRHGL